MNFYHFLKFTVGKPEVITNWLFSKQRTHELTIVFLWFVFPWDIWSKINKLLKYCEYELTKRCLEGRLEGFIVSQDNEASEYQIAKKSYDFHHCCRWLHHHYSWGCHVRFWRLDSKSVISYCFLKEKSLYLHVRHQLQNERGLHTFKLLLLLWKASLHETYSHTVCMWKCWTLLLLWSVHERIWVFTQ